MKTTAVAATLLLVATAVRLPAQWQALTPGTAGLNDPGLAAASLAATGEVATIGELGAFVHTGLRVRTVAGPTPVRSGAAMAGDDQRGRIVMFGGMTAGGQVLADTWEYDGTAWTQRLPATSPAPRHKPTLVHDSWRQRTVLTGGHLGGLGLGDTWEWDGTAWTQRFVNQPGLRGGGCGTFDAARGLVHVFGGSTTPTGPIRYDHWHFDGVNWTRIQLPTMPPGRSDAAMAFDPFTGNITLFGGDDGSTLLADTWQWDGRVWSQLNPATAPAGRSGHAMAFDAPRQRSVLFGGTTLAGARGERWTWTPDARARTTPFGSVCGNRTLAASPGSLPELGTTFRMDVGVPTNPLFVSVGFSNVASGGVPLPAPLPGSATCRLWIDPAVSMFFVPGPAGVWPLAIPLQSGLAGLELYTQTFELTAGPTPTFDSSNGLEVRLGIAVPPQVTTTLLDPASLEAKTSAIAAPGGVGGGGRHGSFDIFSGEPVAPSVYEFDTDHTPISAARTLSNAAEVVADGRYYFSDFVVPAGLVARFRGSSPARIHVRGNVQLDGRLDCSAPPMTTFVSHGTTPAIPGQPGGRAGPGGGTGGKGADRCLATGPLFIGGVNQYDGRDGDDVKVRAGHAYAAQAAGTGGKGGLLYPSSGLASSLSYTLLNVLNAQIAAGGGGGGHRFAGMPGTVVPQANLLPGPATPGGLAFALPSVPAGTDSVDHYLVGGAGGGGGGSHAFLAIVSSPTDLFRAGAGGSGGGGAVAVRCGRDLILGTGSQISACGGNGTVFSSLANGAAAPGGGGSGGSILLQAVGQLQNLGTLDVRGSGGSRIDQLPAALTAVSTGGLGSVGRIRLESQNPIIAGTTLPTIGASDLGPLLDQDAESGVRSVWLPVGTQSNRALLVRYELTVLWNGNTITFSDDPAVGPALADPFGPIVARFQGTQADPSGAADASQVGPWRSSFGTASGTAAGQDTCNRDAPLFVRIDLRFPAANRPIVQDCRFYWR